MLQDSASTSGQPFGRVTWYPAVLMSSALVVGSWGYFLYQGVTDPLGGVNPLWPIFGISNQLLAAIALCVGTTVIVKMGEGDDTRSSRCSRSHGSRSSRSPADGRRFFRPIKIGFLSHARAAKNCAGTAAARRDRGDAARMMFNDRLDAAVVAIFMIVVVVILVDSARVWIGVFARHDARRQHRNSVPAARSARARNERPTRIHASRVRVLGPVFIFGPRSSSSSFFGPVFARARPVALCSRSSPPTSSSPSRT